MKAYLKDGSFAQHAVIKRHLASEYKRHNPLNLTREQILITHINFVPL
jgi:hypothetical protein